MFLGVTVGMTIGSGLPAGLFGAAVAWGSHDGYDTEAWSLKSQCEGLLACRRDRGECGVRRSFRFAYGGEDEGACNRDGGGYGGGARLARQFDRYG